MTDSDVFHVLVIEDSEDLAFMLGVQLNYELPDHIVSSITNHFETVCQKSTFDEINIAIVDVMLPGISGLDILYWMEQNVPDVYRIAWTAVPNLKREGETHAHVVIEKSGDVNLLVKKIREGDSFVRDSR